MLNSEDRQQWINEYQHWLHIILIFARQSIMASATKCLSLAALQPILWSCEYMNDNDAYRLRCRWAWRMPVPAAVLRQYCDARMSGSSCSCGESGETAWKSARPLRDAGDFVLLLLQWEPRQLISFNGNTNWWSKDLIISRPTGASRNSRASVAVFKKFISLFWKV